MDACGMDVSMDTCVLWMCLWIRVWYGCVYGYVCGMDVSMDTYVGVKRGGVMLDFLNVYLKYICFNTIIDTKLVKYNFISIYKCKIKRQCSFANLKFVYIIFLSKREANY